MRVEVRVEDRTGVMKPADDKTPNIICICEDEAESKIVDLLGKVGARVQGELHLADGYGEFYIRLEPYEGPKPSEFTNRVSNYSWKAAPAPWKVDNDPREDGADQVLDVKGRTVCFMSTGWDEDGDNAEFIANARLDLPEALLIIRNLVQTINEAIELMDEEPAKELLRKAMR